MLLSCNKRRYHHLHLKITLSMKDIISCHFFWTWQAHFCIRVKTYIVVPTADNYSLNLGAAASVCGVVIGSMAVAQVFASVYFSAWSNRSYLRPLIFSTIVLMIGNIVYALAYDLNSVVVLLMGHFLWDAFSVDTASFYTPQSQLYSSCRKSKSLPESLRIWFEGRLNRWESSGLHLS